MGVVVVTSKGVVGVSGGGGLHLTGGGGRSGGAAVDLTKDGANGVELVAAVAALRRFLGLVPVCDGDEGACADAGVAVVGDRLELVDLFSELFDGVGSGFNSGVEVGFSSGDDCSRFAVGSDRGGAGVVELLGELFGDVVHFDDLLDAIDEFVAEAEVVLEQVVDTSGVLFALLRFFVEAVDVGGSGGAEGGLLGTGRVSSTLEGVASGLSTDEEIGVDEGVNFLVAEAEFAFLIGQGIEAELMLGLCSDFLADGSRGARGISATRRGGGLAASWSDRGDARVAETKERVFSSFGANVLSSIVDFDGLGALEDGSERVLKTCGEGGEMTDLRGEIFVRGSRDAETFDGARDARDGDTKVFGDELDGGEGEDARFGADGDEAFSSEERMRRASGSETANTVAELLEVEARVVGDALEDGGGGGADGAEGGDAKGEELSTSVMAESSVLVGLLGLGGVEECFEGLALVGRSKLVDDADIESEGFTLGVGEEDVGALSAHILSCLVADLRVLDVGVVVEVQAARTVVLAECSWFLDDVGVAGVTEAKAEVVNDGVVALGDSTARDSSAANDVTHPFLQRQESRALVAGGREVVRAFANVDGVAAGAGVGGIRGGGGVLGSREGDEAEVGTRDVFRGASSGASEESRTSSLGGLEVDRDRGVHVGELDGVLLLTRLVDVLLLDLVLLASDVGVVGENRGSVSSGSGNSSAGDAETTFLERGRDEGLLRDGECLALSPLLEEELDLSISVDHEVLRDVGMVDASDVGQ